MQTTPMPTAPPPLTYKLLDFGSSMKTTLLSMFSNNCLKAQENSQVLNID